MRTIHHGIAVTEVLLIVFCFIKTIRQGDYTPCTTLGKCPSRTHQTVSLDRIRRRCTGTSCSKPPKPPWLRCVSGIVERLRFVISTGARALFARAEWRNLHFVGTAVANLRPESEQSPLTLLDTNAVMCSTWNNFAVVRFAWRLADQRSRLRAWGSRCNRPISLAASRNAPTPFASSSPTASCT